VEQKMIWVVFSSIVAVTGIAVLGLYLLTFDFQSLLPSFSSPKTESVIITPLATPTNSPIPEPAPEPEKVLGESTEESEPTPTPSPAIQIDHAKIYSLINAYRIEQSLSPLQVHSSLEQSAARKLQDMIKSKYWQHQDQDGDNNWSFFEQSGYHYQYAGENLSFGNNSAWDIFDAWVKSPKHNAQLLSKEYEDMGLVIDCQTYQEAGTPDCIAVLHLGKELI